MTHLTHKTYKTMLGVPQRSWHYRAVAAVLVLTFLTGGGSYDRGLGDVAAQLTAIPLLAWSVWSAGRTSELPLRWSLAGVGLVVTAVAIQCLPLSAGVWEANQARAALLADLSTAGVDLLHLHWSMTPSATERSVWSLLPALALFVSALLLDQHQRRRTVLMVIGLVLGSVVLGYIQLGVPQDSLLNPFPEWVPAFTGVFASPNHQATAITVALVLLFALFLERRNGRLDGAPSPHWYRLALTLAGCLLLISLPVTGSRAMGLLALLGLVAVPSFDGTFLTALRSSGVSRWWAWLGLAVAALVVLGVILAGLQWIRLDASEEVRGALAAATYQMGWQLAPWGGGVGSFVPWFDQSAPDRLFGWEYFNHAHNEYVQWWLEAGVPGMVALAAALALLVWSRPSHRQAAGERGPDAPSVGSWVAVVLVLAHSVVDYPLRTPTMMSTTALLAGIAVAAALKRNRKHLLRR